MSDFHGVCLFKLFYFTADFAAQKSLLLLHLFSHPSPDTDCDCQVCWCQSTFSFGFQRYPQKALCIQWWTNIILISELQFLSWMVSLNQLCPLSSSVYRSWQAAQVNFGSGGQQRYVGQLQLQCVHSRCHSIFKVEAADWVPRSVSSVTCNVIFSLSGEVEYETL